MDLWCPALRTKRPTILDLCPTLLARVFHLIEASAQRTGEQGRALNPGLLDRVVLTCVQAQINQRKPTSPAAVFNRNNVLIFLGSNF
jgi:hypothetical protein